MKHTDLKRTVKNTASVLAASLLMGMLTGCFGLLGPKPPNESQTVTITVKGDEGVIVNEPKTLEVAKGKIWREVKNNVNVSYKDGYKAKGFELDAKYGSFLHDLYSFYQNTTVFAISKKIPQPNDPDLFKTDGNGVITGYTCDEEDLPKALIIPAKIGNEVITGISDGAFKGCTGLTSIDLSGCTSLTKIGSGAFNGCTGLASIDLSGCTSLTEIGYEAFNGCTGLASIDLSACTSLTEIGYKAFKGCSKLTGTIVFPASLKTIKSCIEGSHPYEYYVGAFEGCTKLQGADFSACTNFTHIENSTFSYCTGLTEVKLPESLNEIGKYAFYGCAGLTEVKLPASLNKIDAYAFYGCAGLNRAVFADKNDWKVYNNYNYSGTPTPISSRNLDNAATAAKYLREKTDNGGYCDKWWKKN